MYGLKQAAILAYDNLKQGLAPHGYAPIIGTVGICGHKTRPATFCLCVNDFEIKYFNKLNAQHLLDAICQIYKYTTDWEEKNYCGLALDWHYSDEYLDISMPEYLKKMLLKLHHQPQITPQYSPHVHVPINYATKHTRQYAATPDSAPFLTPTRTKYIQYVTGSHLYYGRAIDHTIITVLNNLSSEQFQSTKKKKIQGPEPHGLCAYLP